MQLEDFFVEQTSATVSPDKLLLLYFEERLTQIQQRRPNERADSCARLTSATKASLGLPEVSLC
jgi:hypothetical protein